MEELSAEGGTYVGRLGRYVNDGVGDETNAKMCKLGASTPHLALFATKPIQNGEEIRYDYGANDLSMVRLKPRLICQW